MSRLYSLDIPQIFYPTLWGLCLVCALNAVTCVPAAPHVSFVSTCVVCLALVSVFIHVRLRQFSARHQKNRMREQ